MTCCFNFYVYLCFLTAFAFGEIVLPDEFDGVPNLDILGSLSEKLEIPNDIVLGTSSKKLIVLDLDNTVFESFKIEPDKLTVNKFLNCNKGNFVFSFKKQPVAIYLRPGIKTFIENLREQGYEIGVFSANPDQYVRGVTSLLKIGVDSPSLIKSHDDLNTPRMNWGKSMDLFRPEFGRNNAFLLDDSKLNFQRGLISVVEKDGSTSYLSIEYSGLLVPSFSWFGENTQKRGFWTGECHPKDKEEEDRKYFAGLLSFLTRDEFKAAKDVRPYLAELVFRSAIKQGKITDAAIEHLKPSGFAADAVLETQEEPRNKS
jgi:hypothetical protein